MGWSGLVRAVMFGLFLTGCGGGTAPGPDDRVPAEPFQWPRSYPVPDGGEVVFYEPQLEDLDAARVMRGRFAVAVHDGTSAEPVLGTVVVSGQTAIDRESHAVLVNDLRVVESSFPGLDEATAASVAARVQSALPAEVLTTVERMAAHIDESKVIGDTPGVIAEAPPIYVSKGSAVLIQYDGEPILVPVGGALSYVVNTNWDVLTDGSSWYTRLDQGWLVAPAATGPWTAATALPASFDAIPSDDPNWADVAAAIPGTPLGAAPAVFVSKRPAELIVIDGEPSMTPIPDTSLLWVTNTDSDLFLSTGDSRYWFLVAGRWFAAASLDGPWAYATRELPADFAKIPADHPRARVLPSVPGTPDAQEALLLASAPEKATVSRDLKAPDVAYAGGAPVLEPVEGTALQAVVNTPHDILVYEDRYYMCEGGVWFVSAGPDGPWEVADTIPTEFAKIPTDSELHDVTYVEVEDSTDIDVTFVVAPAYMGLYAMGGVVVWGAGWYHPPYVHYGWGPYPYYRGYPPCYGMGAYYNPYSGAYGRRAVAYGPYGGAGRTAAYNPHTGTYARGASHWGPYGAEGVAHAWNPRTGTSARTHQVATPYGQWGASEVRRGNDWAQTGHYSGTEGAAAGYRTSEGSAGLRAVGDEGAIAARRDADGNTGFVARNDQGDVYAGRDGNVYRRTDDGWETHGDGGWQDVERPGGGSDGATPKDGPTAGTRDVASRDVPSAGTRDVPSAGTRDLPSAGTRDAPSAGTRDVPSAGTRDVPSAGTHDRPSAGYQDLTVRPTTPSAGTRDVPSAGSRDLPSAGSLPSPTSPTRTPSPSTLDGLDRDYGARQLGTDRSSSWQSSRGSSSYPSGGVSRPSGGSVSRPSGGGGRVGGGRR